jgi:hypothetical protein
LATNFYFNNFQSAQEQELIENLVIESIKIYGHDIKYVQRIVQDKDKIYGEDRQTSKYTSAFDVEMYITSVDGFEGDGNFLSKFNLEIRDQITFTVANRAFNNEIGSVLGIDRPREGDLIYFPLNKKLFEIKFVDNKPVFYQLGALQMYNLKCELFEYTGELFNTGEPEIDALYQNNFLGAAQPQIILLDNIQSKLMITEDEKVFTTEGVSIEDIDTAAENETIQDEADEFLDFSETNPFSEGGRY